MPETQPMAGETLESGAFARAHFHALVSLVQEVNKAPLLTQR
jgi:hypothetical protein